MPAKTDAQRALSNRQRLKALGRQQKIIWIDAETGERLRRKFPGHAGGIRWGDVVLAALAAHPRW